MAAGKDTPARRAGSGSICGRVETIQQARESKGHELLSHSFPSCEQIGVGRSPLLHGATEEVYDAVVSYGRLHL